MILVDIYIPSLDETFDFRLNETSTVEQIIKEIKEILTKRIKESNNDNQKDFILCSIEQEEQLSNDKTLSECRIKNGSRLIFV